MAQSYDEPYDFVLNDIGGASPKSSKISNNEQIFIYVIWN